MWLRILGVIVRRYIDLLILLVSVLFPYFLFIKIFFFYIYIYIHFNNMKKEVGMLLQKTTDTRAVGIYKLYEENTH